MRHGGEPPFANRQHHTRREQRETPRGVGVSFLASQTPIAFCFSQSFRAASSHRGVGVSVCCLSTTISFRGSAYFSFKR